MQANDNINNYCNKSCINVLFIHGWTSGWTFFLQQFNRGTNFSHFFPLFIPSYPLLCYLFSLCCLFSLPWIFSFFFLRYLSPFLVHCLFLTFFRFSAASFLFSRFPLSLFFVTFLSLFWSLFFATSFFSAFSLLVSFSLSSRWIVTNQVRNSYINQEPCEKNTNTGVIG